MARHSLGHWDHIDDLLSAQRRPSRTMAFRMTSSLRMQAVNASLAGRPAWMRRWSRGAHRRVEVDRREGGHEQHLAHAAAATGHHAAPAEGAAVAVDRRDPDQGRDAAPVEAAQLRQLGHQRASGDRADSRDRGQQVLGGAPHRRAPDGVVEVTLDPGERLVQPDEVALQGVDPEPAPARPAGDVMAPRCAKPGRRPRHRPSGRGDTPARLRNPWPNCTAISRG
jgi:hypothetical protein